MALTPKQLAEQIIQVIMNDINKAHKPEAKTSEAKPNKFLEDAFDEPMADLKADNDELLRCLDDCNDLLDYAQYVITSQVNEINQLTDYVKYLETKLTSITNLINY